MLKILEQAKKFGGLNTARPIFFVVVLLHVKHTFGPHRVEFMQINCWAISLMLCMDQILVGHFDLTFRPFMEWLLSFRRFLPDVTIHAMIKKMSVLRRPFCMVGFEIYSIYRLVFPSEFAQVLLCFFSYYYFA